MEDISKPLDVARIARIKLGLALGMLAAAALFLLTATLGFAEKGPAPAEISIEELMKPGDLPDSSIGAADAKVTIVEYASLTCPHCQKFATSVFPEFKTKYIDTGKVRLIFRGFALNPLDTAAQMLTRCGADDKIFPLVEAFYEKQADWAFTNGNPVPKLFDIAKQAGYTQETFDKCLKDQALLDKINAVRTRASDTFGVNATPTFFINGKKLTEVPAMASFDKVLEPLLATK